MKVELFEGISENMSSLIVKTPLNNHQLKDLNLLKIFCIQVKSSKGHSLVFLLMGKSNKGNMPLVKQFWLKAVQNCLYLLCHNHMVESFFPLQ